MSGWQIWLVYVLVFGALFSAVTMALTAFSLWKRRHEWESFARWWSAASAIASLWALSVTLGLITPTGLAVPIVHVGRLFASWTAWLFVAALAAVFLPETRFWRWNALLGLGISAVIWAFLPWEYEVRTLGTTPLAVHLVVYRASPIALLLDTVALLSALVIVVMRGRVLMGRRDLFIGFLGVLIIGLFLVGLYLLGLPSPWDWITAFLWILGLYLIWLIRKREVTPLVGYQTLLERLPEGVALLDAHHRLLWYNPAFRQLWPWPFRERGMLNPAELPQQTRYILTSVPLEQPMEWEEHVGTAQGERHLRLRSVPLQLWGQVRARVLYVDDVTLRRQAQERLQQYLSQIRMLNLILEAMMDLKVEDEAARLRNTLQGFLQGGSGFQARAVALYVYDEEARVFRLGLVLGLLRHWFRDAIPMTEAEPQLQQPLALGNWPLAREEPFPLSSYTLPLRVGNHWLGFLWLAGAEGDALDASARSFLQQSAQLLAQALYLHAVMQQRRWLMRAFLSSRAALVVLSWPEARPLLSNPQARSLGLISWLRHFLASEAAASWHEALRQGRPVEARVSVPVQEQARRMWVLGIPLVVDAETHTHIPRLILWIFQDITHLESLLDQLQRQTAFVEGLLRLSQSILSGGMRMTDMLRRILKSTADIVGAEAGTLILVDDQRRPYATFTGQELYPPSEFTYQAVQKGIAGWVLEHRSGLLVEDALKDPRWLPGGRYPWRSVLCVPLYYRDTPLAVLTLTHHEPHRFSQDDLRLLEAAADVTALALYTVRLYEEQYYLTRQAREAREEAQALLRQRQMIMAALGQALAPLVEDIRTSLRMLEARLPDEARTWMDRLWEAWLELYRFTWTLPAARVTYRPLQVTPVAFPALAARIQETLAPWLQHHDIRLYLEVPEGLTLEVDEARLFYTLLLLLYFSLKLARGEEAFLSVAPKNGRVQIRLDAPAPGMEKEERHLIQAVLTQGIEVAVLQARTPGTGLPLLATMLQQLHAELHMEDTPDGRFICLLSLPLHLPSGTELAAQSETRSNAAGS